MRRTRSKTHSAASQPRPARRVDSRATGSVRGKLPSATACPSCGATYRGGRWTWQSAPDGATEHVCPACERIAQKYPAGVLTVVGAFAASHRDELLALVRHVEERERNRHPLKRIMRIATKRNGFVAETTDGKLAQALGRALNKAYAGALEHSPTTADVENLVRVKWIRD